MNKHNITISIILGTIFLSFLLMLADADLSRKHDARMKELEIIQNCAGVYGE